MTTAEAVVRTMVVNGIDKIFCLPGVQNDFLFDALHGAQGRIRAIHTRHEQGAAYMALGAALATGKPAAYAVVPGPGVLNTTAALCTAYAVNAPVLALTGDIPSPAIGRGLGFLHEIPDQLAHPALAHQMGRAHPLAAGGAGAGDRGVPPASLRPAAPGGARMPARHLAAQRSRRAASGAGRRRASIPSISMPSPPRPSSWARPSARSSSSAAARWMPAPRCEAVAEMLQAPVVAHQMGRGVLDSRHPLSVSSYLGFRLWGEADVVLAVGTRLSLQQRLWGTDDALKIVRIDADPEEIDRIARPAVGIVGDSARVLARSSRRAARATTAAGPRATDEMRARKAEADAELAQKFKPQVGYLEAIRAELPEDGIFVDELTQIGYVGRLAFPVYRPRTYLSSGYQGTLGWGVATAIGAKAARPDTPLVAISGDGGFMFNVQELATAVQHRIPVVIVLTTDNAYGNVRRTQVEAFGNRVIASDLKNPDFLKFAESFGVMGLRATTPDELRVQLRKALGVRRSPRSSKCRSGRCRARGAFFASPSPRVPAEVAETRLKFGETRNRSHSRFHVLLAVSVLSSPAAIRLLGTARRVWEAVNAQLETVPAIPLGRTHGGPPGRRRRADGDVADDALGFCRARHRGHAVVRRQAQHAGRGRCRRLQRRHVRGGGAELDRLHRGGQGHHGAIWLHQRQQRPRRRRSTTRRTSGNYTTNASAIEVIVSQPQTMLFAQLFLSSPPTVLARAVAVTSASTPGTSPDGCVMALDKGNVTDINDGGGATLNLKQCSIYVNSSSSSALTMTGGAQINAKSAYIVGNYSAKGGAALNTTAGTNTGVNPTADPYASVQVPSYSACNQTGFSKASTGTTSLGPTTSGGTYVFCNGLSLAGGATLNLSAGVYIINGGNLSVKGGATINATGGVTIILTSSSGSNYGTVSIAGGTNVNVTAPTTGPTAGLAFFQDRNAPQGPANDFTGGTTQNITGAIYFPNETVSYTGGATTGGAVCTQLIALTLSFVGTSTLSSSCSGTGVKGIGGTTGSTGQVALVE